MPMEQTTVLITGCSSGIGLGLAARLAADSARRFKGKGATLCHRGSRHHGGPGTEGFSPRRSLGRQRCPAAPFSPPVFATMRDLAKSERLWERLGGGCPETLELLQLDVTDPRSLAAAAQRVQGQRLDVLGTALTAPPGDQPGPGAR